MVNLYLVTVKNNTNEFTSLWDLTHALVILRRLQPRSDWTDNVRYELDKAQKLHIHTLMMCPINIRYKDIIKRFKEDFPTYVVDFRKFPRRDLRRVYNYITKEPRSRFELEQESLINFSNRQYSIVDE